MVLLKCLDWGDESDDPDTPSPQKVTVDLASSKDKQSSGTSSTKTKPGKNFEL